MPNEPRTASQMEVQSSFLMTRLVDFGFDFGLGSALVEDFDLALVLVDFGSDSSLVEDFDLALGLVDCASGFSLVEDFDFALVLVDLGSDSCLLGDLVLDLVEPEEDFDLEETRTVFSATDLPLDFAEVFEMDVLRRDSLAEMSGIDPCGGCSLLAIKGISSDLNSCGEGALPLLRHLAGLSAQAST